MLYFPSGDAIISTKLASFANMTILAAVVNFERNLVEK